MSAALAIQKLTLADVIQLERHTGKKQEILDGEIQERPDEPLNHWRICSRISEAIETQIGLSTFEIYQGIRLELPFSRGWTYPDVMLSCHAFDTKKNNLFARFPSLIVEVVSKSTAAIDRGRKMLAYRNMPSVKHYLLVSQYEVLVEVYSRIEDSRFFRHAVYQSLEEEIELEHLEFNLPVGKIYEGIEFEEPTDED